MKHLLRSRRWLASCFFGKRPWIADCILGAIGTSVAILLVREFGACPINELLKNDGTALYGSVLAAATALLGFAVAAITIVSGLVTADVFSALRGGKHYEAFWCSFTWTVRALGLLSLVSFLAIFVNKYDPARPYVGGVEFWVASVAGWSLVRSGFTLELLLGVVREDQRRRAADTHVESHYPPV